MKHIKSYTLFESLDINSEWNQSVLNDEVWNDISDILLELEHEGFIASRNLHDFKKVSNKLCEDVIEIIVNKHSTEDFNYEEVKDTFMRLIDYLEPFGWNYSILYFPPIGQHHFIEFECGGKDPLISQHFVDWDMVSKSRLEKILKECHAFKICFYQGIDHLIN
jgi:hypothetical protein